MNIDRDDLGRVVRAAWIVWASHQPYTKPSWMVEYDELSDADKEADRMIGEAVQAFVESHADEAYTESVDEYIKKLPWGDTSANVREMVEGNIKAYANHLRYGGSNPEDSTELSLTNKYCLGTFDRAFQESRQSGKELLHAYDDASESLRKYVIAVYLPENKNYSATKQESAKNG